MNIIKSGLFSVLVHGLVAASCFAFSVQKLVPLFQSGNSALTLTSLSIAAPAGEQSVVEPEPVRDEQAENEEDHAEDFQLEPPDKKFAEKAVPKNKEAAQPALDADAMTKGVTTLSAESAGIRPCYPLGARLRGEQGVVKVEVCVGSGGQVLDCAIARSSGHPALDNAALKAVKLARFISAECRAIKNRTKTVLTFRFALVD